VGTSPEPLLLGVSELMGRMQMLSGCLGV
jgi:hypothetical protein